jgi:hypothetical protein
MHACRWEIGTRALHGVWCMLPAQVVYAGQVPPTSTGVGQMRLAVITPPPLLPWSKRSHTVFPAGFRNAAAALLLCHNRLARHARRAHRPSCIHDALL